MVAPKQPEGQVPGENNFPINFKYAIRMPRLCILVGGVSCARAAALARTDAPSWKSVAIGGGGYVLQTFFSLVDSNVYMKTDVGGIYRRWARAGVGACSSLAQS